MWSGGKGPVCRILSWFFVAFPLILILFQGIPLWAQNVSVSAGEQIGRFPTGIASVPSIGTVGNQVSVNVAKDSFPVGTVVPQRSAENDRLRTDASNDVESFRSAGVSVGDELGNLRINLTWNTEKPVTWVGEIALSEGYFVQTVPLGNDLTSPGTFSLKDAGQGHIFFRNQTPVLFCGVQYHCRRARVQAGPR